MMLLLVIVLAIAASVLLFMVVRQYRQAGILWELVYRQETEITQLKVDLRIQSSLASAQIALQGAGDDKDK